MRRLDGKVALITGAARGLGRSHAVRFAEEGADVIAVDLCQQLPGVPYDLPDTSELERTAELVRGLGRRCVTAVTDVRDAGGLESAVANGLEELGAIDAVCCNAGAGAFTPVTEISEAAWELIVGVNLTGAWLTIKAALPPMIEAGRGGAIVIISSTAGTRGVPNTAHYASAKHGVVGLMRSVANEVGRHGIRVNTVHPTGVDTEIIQNERTYRLFRPDLDDPGPDDVAEVFRRQNILPVPWIEPRDVSNAVAWLVSDEARYVTGETLHVDAGFSQKVR